MVYKTKLTSATENLVAYNTLKSGYDILAKRADRKMKPLALDVYDRLVGKQKMSEEATVTADYRFEDYEKARTLTEGIKEFSQRFPDYGSKLKEIIKETRSTKRRYVTFGGDVATDVYEQALTDIGIPEHLRDNVMDIADEISDMFSKKREDGLTELLVK